MLRGSMNATRLQMIAAPKSGWRHQTTAVGHFRMTAKFSLTFANAVAPICRLMAKVDCSFLTEPFQRRVRCFAILSWRVHRTAAGILNKLLSATMDGN